MHIRYWIFAAVILAAAGYFFYEAGGVFFAPRLDVYTPKNYAVLTSTNIHIAGKTEPGLKVWVAGKEAFSDNNGLFESDIIAFPGYNSIGISVKDRLGNETRKILQFVVK